MKLARFRKLRKIVHEISPQGADMRFKGGPHENPARGVVTIFLPKSAHAHPNSNNPPGRRDLEAITIAGGASSRSRAAAATERFTIYRRVQGGKCAGPDVEAAGCIRSLVATAHKRHKSCLVLSINLIHCGNEFRNSRRDSRRQEGPCGPQAQAQPPPPVRLSVGQYVDVTTGCLDTCSGLGHT